jgi:hypothetical protein
MQRGLFGALGKPDAHQKSALWHGSNQSAAMRGGATGQRGKINPMRQISGSRLVKNIHRSVSCNGLQTVTGSAIASIIDDQYGTPILTDTACQRGDHLITCTTEFGDIAILWL